MMQAPDWLFVSTTKCATRTMYAVLPQFGGERVDGFHSRPVGQDNRFTFAVCRNPLSRAVSTWWSTCKRDHDKYAFRKASGCDVGGFPKFVEWLTQEAPKDKLTMTQDDWHAGHRVDRFIWTENLDSDFYHLPFIQGVARWESDKMPVEGATDPLREPWQDYHTPETVAMIAEWAAEDFERFGYEAVLPC